MKLMEPVQSNDGRRISRRLWMGDNPGRYIAEFETFKPNSFTSSKTIAGRIIRRATFSSMASPLIRRRFTPSKAS